MPAPARHSSAGRVATLTIRPPAPARSIELAEARQQRNAVTKFMSTCFIKSDFVVSVTHGLDQPQEAVAVPSFFASRSCHPYLIAAGVPGGSGRGSTSTTPCAMRTR